MVARKVASEFVMARLCEAEHLLDVEAGLDGGRVLLHYLITLCVDDRGCPSYDGHVAELLFQIVSRRYERRPIVLTTNLAFAGGSNGEH